MYTQNNEEQYILEAVGDKTGVFLDIGAYDGKTFSNTAALVDRGWSGVLVEPSTHPFNALRERYSRNPKLQLVNAAVGTDSRLVKWWDTGGDAVSTTSPAHYAVWKDTASYFPPYHIGQVTLLDLWDTFPELRSVDLVSIDTEGTSGEIFKAAMGLFTPKLFVVEYDLKDAELCSLATNYESIHKSSENLILAHESIRDRICR